MTRAFETMQSRKAESNGLSTKKLSLFQHSVIWYIDGNQLSSKHQGQGEI